MAVEAAGPQTTEVMSSIRRKNCDNSDYDGQLDQRECRHPRNALHRERRRIPHERAPFHNRFRSVEHLPTI